MPYVNQKTRELHEDTIEHFRTLHAGHTTAGELNYLFSSILHDVIKAQGLNYAKINELIGVLECCKMELYRTVAAPYENKKRLTNGAVSDLDTNWKEQMR